MPRRSAITSPHLSKSALALLQRLNVGETPDVISRRLHLSPGTVRVYAKRLYAVFGVHNRYDLILAARRKGVVPTLQSAGAVPRWLTGRRLHLLELAQRGLSHAQIAGTLRQPQKHVDKAFEYVRRRLDARTTLEAVDRAVEHGFLRGLAPQTVPNILSKRELQIVELLRAGMTPHHIGRHLGIEGIPARVRKLRMKLRVADNEALVRAVDDLGLSAAGRYATRMSRAVTQQIAQHKRPEPLTEREGEVLAALVRWPRKTFDEIGSRLGISRGTVQYYAFRLKRYVGVRTRSELLTHVTQ